MAYLPVQNTSVSGTVGASVIGLAPVAVSNFPANQSVSGAITQGTTPWITNFQNSSIVAFQLAGSVLATSATVNPAANQSVSGTVNVGNFPGITSLVSTVPSSVIVGASIFGLPPVNVTNFPTTQNVSGSVVAFGFPTNQSVSGAVSISNLPANQSVSGAVSVSNFPTTQNVSGSVVAFQGTTPWNIAGSVISVIKVPGTEFRYQGSLVSGSVTLIAASVTSKQHYITDFKFANSGSVATLITFQDGSTSILGYTIAPAGGGSNYPGATVPDRTAVAQDLVFKIAPSPSILYATISGYTL